MRRIGEQVGRWEGSEMVRCTERAETRSMAWVSARWKERLGGKDYDEVADK